MKIINIDINDEIILNSIEDLITGTIKSINSKLKLPTGNYQNILLNFNFISPIPEEDLKLIATFLIGNNSVDVTITSIKVNNKTYRYACYIPPEVFEEPCDVALGLYGFKLDDNENLVKRMSLIPIDNEVVKGSYDPDSKESVVPNPTVFEVYFNKIDNAYNEFNVFVQSLKIKYFNSIDEMKSDNTLNNECMVKTLGYYSANDGGNATYIIRTKKDSDVIDNGFIHSINSTLVAELLIENNTVNIRQLGARSQDKQNNKYDIKPYIDMYLAYLDTIPNRVKLYIPAGVWYSSPCVITRVEGFDIFGDVGFTIHRADGTVISSLNDEQEIIWQIGSTDDYTRNWVLKNIIFTSADCEYRNDLNCYAFKTPKKITKASLNMVYTLFGISDNICFLYIKGEAFRQSSCWENYFGLLNFRHISNHDGCVIRFATGDETLTSNVSVSATVYEKMMFEAVHGDLMQFDHNCRFCNNHFGVINFEDYKYEVDGEIYTSFTDDNINSFDEENAIHQAMFSFGYGANFQSNVIGSIELNNISYRFHEYNDKTYVYDTLIKLTEESDYAQIKTIINNISIIGMNKNMRLIKMPEGANIKEDSEIIFNSIENNNSKDFYFDVKGFPRIKCNSSLKGYLSYETHLGAEFTPFYEVINKRALKTIYSDENSLNKLKLCVKATSMNQIRFLVGGSNINIRAKIPNGETCLLTIVSIDGSKYFNMSMVGTGEFNNYTFDISSKFVIGDEIECRLSSSNTSTSCLLDYYKFY